MVNVSPGGGHLRDLYATSLDEAAVALDRPRLAEAAQAWRSAADAWDELADAAVPPDLDGAADAVEAVETLHDAVMAGEPGRARVRAAAETASTFRTRYDASRSRCRPSASRRSSRTSGSASWPSMRRRWAPSR